MENEAKGFEVPADWSQEDKDWLTKHVLEPLRPVAVRHGRKLFQHTVMCGAATHALARLASVGRGNRAILQAAGFLEQTLNQMGNELLGERGQTIEDFLRCKQDIELTMSLWQGGKPEGNVSPGGIILDS